MVHCKVELARTGVSRHTKPAAALIRLLAIAVVTTACGGGVATPMPPLYRLPHQGVFIRKSSGLPLYPELNLHRGGLNQTILYSVYPEFSPVLLVWRPDFVPAGWHLVTLGKGYVDIPFTAKATSDGIWEL
jgi:hypothetical protein